MKKVKQKHAFPDAYIRPAHDPEWDAIFNRDYDEVPDDLFSQSNNREVMR
ncbi:hypothetical protein HY492_00860 [Candidatus Woesearchaeota archaeon]|nr:hypothetical protein [Candidatus Woesearchaeota archaeon]